MSGKPWREKYEKKHGHMYGSSIVSNGNNHFSIFDNVDMDFESEPAMKKVNGLDVVYPEGTKSVEFHKQCTLLGKVLDGEFILKENETENLMILWQEGLVFLTMPIVLSVDGAGKFYETHQPLKYSPELVERLTVCLHLLSKDGAVNIEERLRSLGINFLHRAYTVGFPDYNARMAQMRYRIREGKQE